MKVHFEYTLSVAHWNDGRENKIGVKNYSDAHGHTWRIAIEVVSENLNEDGLVADERRVAEVVLGFDNCFLPFHPKIRKHPSASGFYAGSMEQFCIVLFDCVKKLTPERGSLMVRVWEGPTMYSEKRA